MVYLALFSPCAWNPLPNSGILTLSANLEVREGVSIKTSDRIHFFLLKGRIRIQFFLGGRIRIQFFFSKVGSGSSIFLKVETGSSLFLTVESGSSPFFDGQIRIQSLIDGRIRIRSFRDGRIRIRSLDVRIQNWIYLSRRSNPELNENKNLGFSCRTDPDPGKIHPESQIKGDSIQRFLC